MGRGTSERWNPPEWLVAVVVGSVMFHGATWLPPWLSSSSEIGFLISPCLSVGEGAAVLGVLVALVIALHVTLWQAGRVLAEGSVPKAEREVNDRIGTLDVALSITAFLGLWVGWAVLLGAIINKEITWGVIGLAGAGAVLCVFSSDSSFHAQEILRIRRSREAKDRVTRMQEDLNRLGDCAWPRVLAHLFVYCYVVGVLWMTFRPSLDLMAVGIYVITVSWLAQMVYLLGRLYGWAYYFLGVIVGVMALALWGRLFFGVSGCDKAWVLAMCGVSLIGIFGYWWPSMSADPWIRGPIAELWGSYVKRRLEDSEDLEFAQESPQQP